MTAQEIGKPSTADIISAANLRPPEVILQTSEYYTEKVDIWAVGCLASSRDILSSS